MLWTKKEKAELLAKYRTVMEHSLAMPYVPDRICSIRQDILAGAYEPEPVRCANGWYDVAPVKRMPPACKAQRGRKEFNK